MPKSLKVSKYHIQSDLNFSQYIYIYIIYGIRSSSNRNNFASAHEALSSASRQNEKSEYHEEARGRFPPSPDSTKTYPRPRAATKHQTRRVAE